MGTQEFNECTEGDSSERQLQLVCVYLVECTTHCKYMPSSLFECAWADYAFVPLPLHKKTSSVSAILRRRTGVIKWEKDSFDTRDWKESVWKPKNHT